MYDLQCDNLSKNFGNFVAVDKVSLSIPSGSFFSILGPSGSGKTTLMRMIAGFEEPTSGDIRIREASVIHTPPNKRNVKMVFQHLALFPMMNVEENIAYGLQCKKLSKREITRRVQEVLERIGLPEVGSKHVNHLSGGQRQRIAIARCMVLEPDVLLLDEPLGALDLKLRERMKVELKLLQHQFATTFLYITHDQSEALVMSDQVAVMNNGRFEQIGTPQELYHDPRTPFVAGFVGDNNRWSGRVTTIDQAVIAVATDTGNTICGCSDDTDRPRVGDNVDIYVRPEYIQADRTQPDSDVPNGKANMLRGQVDSLLFNGANSRLLVRTDAGQLVQASVADTDSATTFNSGDPVALHWRVEKSRIFRARIN